MSPIQGLVSLDVSLEGHLSFMSAFIYTHQAPRIIVFIVFNWVFYINSGKLPVMLHNYAICNISPHFWECVKQAMFSRWLCVPVLKQSLMGLSISLGSPAVNRTILRLSTFLVLCLPTRVFVFIGVETSNSSGTVPASLPHLWPSRRAAVMCEWRCCHHS